jgi:uncharacterized membrane protein
MTRALRADYDRRFATRRTALREWYRDSLTLVPVLCITASLLLAGAMWLAHKYLVVPASLPSWLLGNTASAISVVSVIASSMLSFLAVVFSVTLVALQLASQQFSPRVLRTFVRSTTVKATLGLGTGTFAYSLLLLYFGVIRTEATATLPAVAIDVLLVFATLIAFVMCVREIITMLRIGYIISIVADETHASIQGVFPPRNAYSDCAAVDLAGPRQVIRYGSGRSWRVLRRAAEGVFLSVSNRHLVQLARAHDCTIRVLPRPGDYVVGGEPVLEVHGTHHVAPDLCLSTFSVGTERTIEQDPAFGFRALVDIALQALSPAVNAPTTVTQVLQRLTSLLLDIGSRPTPTGYFADAQGVVRLVRPVVDWKEYVNLAFGEIIDFGASSSQVRDSLAKALDYLLIEASEEHRAPLLEQRRRLFPEVQAPDGEM